MRQVNQEEALAAWEQAREATREAREALSATKQKVREAEAQVQSCYDTERYLWMQVRDTEWTVTRGKGDKILSIQRTNPAEEAIRKRQSV